MAIQTSSIFNRADRSRYSRSYVMQWTFRLATTTCSLRQVSRSRRGGSSTKRSRPMTGGATNWIGLTPNRDVYAAVPRWLSSQRIPSMIWLKPCSKRCHRVSTAFPTPKALHSPAQGRAAHPGDAGRTVMVPTPKALHNPAQGRAAHPGDCGTPLGFRGCGCSRRPRVRLRRPWAWLCNAFGVTMGCRELSPGHADAWWRSARSVDLSAE